MLSFACFGQKNAKGTVDTTYDHGSNITFPELTPQVIDNLDLLGRIWGFLKYHHPTIAKGQYNWDYELFRMLPSYLQQTNTQQRDAYLVKWILHYGKIPTNKSITPVDSTAFIKPDLAWINSEQLSPKLYNLLTKIYQNRYQGNKYYVTANPFGARNAKFTHENPYSNMYYPDAGYRLLTVYRYWNMLQYFFPYKYLTDTDWNDVMKESIPILLKAQDTVSYISAVKQMIAKCDDSHAVVYSESMRYTLMYNRPPFNVRFLRNDTLVIDSYRNPEKIDENGPHIGDVITHINHQPISRLIDSLKPFFSASNYIGKLNDISDIIVCQNEPSVNLTFITEGKTKNASIPLYSFYDLDYSMKTDSICYKLLDNNIGYISMDDITNKYLNTIKDTIKGTKGLIIDMREYPHEFVQYNLFAFLSDSSTDFCRITSPSLKNPGEFAFENPIITPAKEGEGYKGQVVILINEQSGSQSEFATMLYRKIKNSIVLGSNSVGADGDVTKVELPGGICTYFSGLGIYYPDGSETQRIGIVPDIYGYPTVKGIREGRDELLEKAIEIIKNS